MASSITDRTRCATRSLFSDRASARMGRELTASFACLIAAASVLVGAEAAAITFDDGLVHVIDAGNSYPFDLLFVENSLEGAPTTVDVVAGGEIATQFVSGDSFIRGTSVLNLSGGFIGGNNVPGTGDTIVRLTNQFISKMTC